MNDRTRLEQAAVDAHDRGETWPEFWEAHRYTVGQIEPFDRAAYGRLVNRLLLLVVAGDTDGHRAVGDGEPWQADDEPPLLPIIDDTTTAARCLWTPEEEGRPQVDHEAIVTAGPRASRQGQERTTRCGR